MYMQTSFQSTFSEQLWVKISLSENHQLLVGSIYRSTSLDNISSTNELSNLITSVNSTKPAYLVI